MENNEPASPVSASETDTSQLTQPLAGTGKLIQPITPGLTAQPAASEEQVNSTDNIATPANIYPQAQYSVGQPMDTAANTILTGSQMVLEKKKIPAGIYVIAAVNLLGFIGGFLDGTQTSAIYSAAIFINLLLAVGLILRQNWARKAMIVVSVLLLVLSIVSSFLLVGLQDRMQQRKADYETAVSRVDQSKLSPSSRKTLEDTRIAIAKEENQTDQVITATYVRLGISVVAALAMTIYLTRPKVTEVFNTPAG